MWKVSRKYLLGAAFAGVAALGVTQAQAQGPWSGPYIGLHAGYGWGDANITHDIGVPALNPHDSFNTKGWLLGAQLGLNVQVGSFVLGGELSLSDASIKGTKANCAPVLFGPGIDTCRKEDDWLLLAMGKVGFAFSSNVMAYGTAGLAVAGVTSNDVFPAPVSPTLFRTSAVHNGWAYGAGIDYRIPLVPCSGHGMGCGSSWVVGLQYLHVNLDEATHNPSLLFPRHVSQDADIVRANLSIKMDFCCGQRPLK
jgi:outer membrane immunogenic protein